MPNQVVLGRLRHTRSAPRPAFGVLVVAAMALAFTYFSFGDPPPAMAATLDVSSTPVKFVYSATDPQTGLANPNGRSNGDRVIYRNVTAVGGLAVDAVVTTTLSNATVSNYDNPGQASASNPIAGTVATENFQVDVTTTAAYGTARFQFQFFEATTYTGPGSGIPVVLRNVTVTSIDLDGAAPRNQFTDLTGFQSYTVTSSPATAIGVTSPTPGVARFTGNSGVNGNNVPTDRVSVVYDTLSTFEATFGTNAASGTAAFYGLLFVPAPWAGCSCSTTTVNNPYNRAPTSTDDSRNVVSGVPTSLEVADFGTFTDADSNPFYGVRVATLPAAGALEQFVSGAWQPVAAGELIPTAQIDTGTLRYTTTAPSSFTFRVNDVLVDSAATYTLSFAVSLQSQTITFASPGARPPDTTFASGATASSGLTVTLTSLTPGICTVSGLSITTITAGSCTIEATQAGDATYGAAAPVSQTFAVSTKTSQSITFTDPGQQTFSGTPFDIPSNATASSGLAVSLASLTVGTCTVSGLMITIVATGSCSVRASQAGDATYAAASPVEQTFLVSAPAPPTTTTTTLPPTTTTLPPTTTVAPTTTTTTVAPTTTLPPTTSTTTVVPTTTTTVVPTTTLPPTTTVAPTTTLPPTTTVAPTTTTTLPPTTTTVAPMTTTTTVAPTTTTTTTTTPTTTTPTTITPPTTTPPTTTPPTGGTTGEVAGVVWFDADRDGRRDADEPVLPGLLVAVDPATQPEGSIGAAAAASGITPIVRTVLTDARGAYRVTDLGAGRYEVALSVPAGAAADPSWQLAGGAARRAAVDVAPSQTALVDFAATGSGAAQGVVVDPAGDAVPQASVTCTWNGVDGRFGTSDDVTFTTVAGGDGAWEFDNLPSGSVACYAVDSGTGSSTSSVIAPATATAPWVVLQFGAAGGVGAAPAQLPATGGSILPLLRAGLMLVILGSITVLVTRRRVVSSTSP